MILALYFFPKRAVIYKEATYKEEFILLFDAKP